MFVNLFLIFHEECADCAVDDTDSDSSFDILLIFQIFIGLLCIAILFLLSLTCYHCTISANEVYKYEWISCLNDVEHSLKHTRTQLELQISYEWDKYQVERI